MFRSTLNIEIVDAAPMDKDVGLSEIFDQMNSLTIGFCGNKQYRRGGSKTKRALRKPGLSSIVLQAPRTLRLPFKTVQVAVTKKAVQFSENAAFKTKADLMMTPLKTYGIHFAEPESKENAVPIQELKSKKRVPKPRRRGTLLPARMNRWKRKADQKKNNKRTSKSKRATKATRRSRQARRKLLQSARPGTPFPFAMSVRYRC